MLQNKVVVVTGGSRGIGVESNNDTVDDEEIDELQLTEVEEMTYNYSNGG